MDTIGGITGRSRISNGDGTLGTDTETSRTPAVRGRSAGREGWTGATNGRGMAAALGWFSVGLGVVQIVAPRRMTSAIGLDPGRGSTALMRAMGLREIATGVGILANPKSKEWVGLRVGGDLLDLALLGAVLAKSENRDRTLMAAAAVLGATALDLRGTEQLAQARKVHSRDVMDERGTHVHRTITVERPVHEVYAFWRDFTNLPQFMEHLESVELLEGGRSRWRAKAAGVAPVEWEAELIEDRENERLSWRSVGTKVLYNAGTVHFSSTHDGGTVVTVEMQYAPTGGLIGSAVLKLFRKQPSQQVGDDLRRFKQVLETGEVLKSDATATSGPHPAQPARRNGS
jgi:uncharacterized membrane protein